MRKIVIPGRNNYDIACTHNITGKEKLVVIISHGFGSSKESPTAAAMAEALNSLFKTECIRNPVMRPKGGWKTVVDVEIAVAEYIDWHNHRRRHGEIGHIPPAEYETNYWASRTPDIAVGFGCGLLV